MAPPGPHHGDLFRGEGGVPALCRAVEWESTALGPPEAWAPTLRAAVRSALGSPFPMNLWCEPDLTLIYNDAYADVLGAKHPEALGRPGDEVWGEIWDEIAPMFDRIRDGGPAVYAEDAPFVISRTNGPDGDGSGSAPNAWFTFSLSAVRDEEGRIVAFLNVVSETTRRLLAERERARARQRAERAEARLREVFAQAPAFMAVLRGSDHVFEYVNQAYQDLVGERELLGRSVTDALPEIRGQGFRDLLDSVYETGEPYVGREQPVALSRSGDDSLEERYVDFVYYPVTEADGTTAGVVVHGSDVTSHVHDRKEAENARQQAEEANRAKSQFLATVSHELRTPINAIVGYAELLEMELDGPLTAGQRAHLDRLRGSSRHLLMLIDDLLDLSRVEAGRVEVSRERFPAGRAVGEAVELVEPQAREAGLHLERRCDPADIPEVAADPERVRQILVNLLSNAIKFTEAGGSVAIRCGSVDPGEDMGPPPGAEGEDWGGFVSVTDTGIGIDPEDIERIFEPFAQAEPGLTRERGGVGLGLTISRRLARLMGGDLTARSEPGEGSTFTLWLPPPGNPSGSGTPPPRRGVEITDSVDHDEIEPPPDGRRPDEPPPP